MTHRERVNAILHYQPYDRMPVVHFGFWPETLEKWAAQGHIPAGYAEGWKDGNDIDRALSEALGFDFNWYRAENGVLGLMPPFAPITVETRPDGSQIRRTGDGALVLVRPGVVSIPTEIDHTLKDRASWEREVLPRLRFTEERVKAQAFAHLKDRSGDELPLGLYCGSLFGDIRNWAGLEGISYLYADDEELYREIIDTVGDLCYRVTEALLGLGIPFDFGHFWEDICFKNGPLVIPSVFDEMVGPHYARITALLGRYGIDIVSLDCDGKIDSLIPTWLKNGVNTMFPIEVGTWDASIAPWRERYGRELRGVGGMNKTVFAWGFEDIDREIERLIPLVGLGGFIPCPDHRIAPDAEWENVRYYCRRMHEIFG